MLPKMGFNWHHPKAIIFGLKIIQGKGLAILMVRQYTNHLERFVEYLQHNKEEENLLRIQMD